jgi:hypothetical protein
MAFSASRVRFSRVTPFSLAIYCMNASPILIAKKVHALVPSFCRGIWCS